MNKPSPGPLSDLVPKRPEVSALQDRTGQDRTAKENPQTPASGGLRKLGETSTAETRANRARNGSRRKRDLEALAATQRTHPPADTQPSDAAKQAWTTAMDMLTQRDISKVAANAHWLEVRGVSDNKVVITTPHLGSFWRKRHGESLGELIRQVSSFDGVLICDEVRS